MSIADKFTKDEWAKVVAAPMVSGIAVTAADPGGLWGALKESAAVAGELRAVKSGAAPNELVAAVTAAYETSEGRDMARGVLKAGVKGKKPAEIVDSALEELKSVAALAAAKAPEAAPGFRAWLGDVARKVAEAGTEGGFMGFGGVKVSTAEAATLERIGNALA